MKIRVSELFYLESKHKITFGGSGVSGWVDGLGGGLEYVIFFTMNPKGGLHKALFWTPLVSAGNKPRVSTLLSL